jgi:gamma-D-glutamyl-L-lysine dipeptidyl-peptidase
VQGLRGRTADHAPGEQQPLTCVIARSAIVPLYAQPSLRSEQVSQLVLGETGQVEERSDSWRRITVELDGYHGWVHAGFVVEADGPAADRWREEAAAWSLGATVRIGGRRVPLPLRARVVVAPSDIRLPDGSAAELVDGTVMPAAEVRSAARAQPPERWALAHFEGAPYAWGGVTPWGVDCSGLVQTAFAARGTRLPRDAALQAECGMPVDLDGAKPGDLLFFRGDSGDRITHVAFAAEADTLVHSTVACGGALQESWLPGSRAAVLRDKLVAVRRLETR